MDRQGETKNARLMFQPGFDASRPAQWRGLWSFCRKRAVFKRS